MGPGHLECWALDLDATKACTRQVQLCCDDFVDVKCFAMGRAVRYIQPGWHTGRYRRDDELDPHQIEGFLGCVSG